MSNFGFKKGGQDPGGGEGGPFDRLADIKPRPAPVTGIDTRAIDAAAAASGFTTREPTRPDEVHYTVPRRKKDPIEPLHPLSMRAPVSVVQRFIDFAETENLSYPKALAKLLDLAEGK
jgi:hypothetical protein